MSSSHKLIFFAISGAKIFAIGGNLMTVLTKNNFAQFFWDTVYLAKIRKKVWCHVFLTHGVVYHNNVMHLSLHSPVWKNFPEWSLCGRVVLVMRRCQFLKIDTISIFITSKYRRYRYYRRCVFFYFFLLCILNVHFLWTFERLSWQKLRPAHLNILFTYLICHFSFIYSWLRNTAQNCIINVYSLIINRNFYYRVGRKSKPT